jgi:hypothetical protein
MKLNSTLGALIAVFAAAPAVVAPQLVANAQAQDAAATTAAAEYPDVPTNHWAYAAINRLSQAGIIEGLPSGAYGGNRAMTRYEFAVAIARLLERIGGGQVSVREFDPTTINNRLTALEARPTPDITRTEVVDLINNLRREFQDELAKLGVRVDALENRVSNLENRVPAPPRLTITPSILHRTGTASYISNSPTPARANFAANAGIGRNIVRGNFGAPAGSNPLPGNANAFFPDRGERFANSKYSYTDFELRLTDRITDRLSVTGALRSLGSTQEDPWGDTASTSQAYLREAYAVADLSDRSFIGIRGLTAILGRQRTKIGQGLLYDNDLQPTDQIHGMFNLGPIAINAFVGSNNNQTFTGGASPYNGAGAVANLGLSGQGAFGGPGGLFFRSPGAPAVGGAALSGAAVGFPGAGAVYPDDNEAAIRGGVNLFRIAGQPVSLGYTYLLDGYQNQRGDSFDLSLPLFGRTIGVEYVRQRQYAGASNFVGKPAAYNVTVPLFRARVLDLNFAYGKADDAFEYFVTSSANPYARTYAEAIFDRPMALGAPLINGRFFGNAGGTPAGLAGMPLYAAAKEAFDFNGTLRVLRRLPLDFRYYKAYGSRLAGGPGGRQNALDLGTLYTIGSTFNVSPGLDLELKYGRYMVPGPLPSIGYIRVGANVGF